MRQTFEELSLLKAFWKIWIQRLWGRKQNLLEQQNYEQRPCQRILLALALIKQVRRSFEDHLRSVLVIFLVSYQLLAATFQLKQLL